MGIKRPFLWLLAAYIAGLAIYAANLPFVIIVFISIIVLLGVMGWILYPAKRRYRLINYFFLLLLPVLFLVGYLQLEHVLLVPEADKDFKLKQNATAQGKISLIEETENYIRVTITGAALTLDYKSSYSGLKLLVYVDDKKGLYTGNTVRVTGKVIKFTKASNPGQFDEYFYYKTKKYHYKFYADSITVINSNIDSYHQTLYTIRKRLTAIYDRLLSGKNAGILTAMMLGDTNNLDADIKELYRKNGITHILAISGLHISLLGLTLYKILRRLRLPLFASTAVTLFFLYSYGILTGFGVSTNRAVVMMAVYMAALLAGRTYDLLSGTAFSALIILMQSPLEIMSAGFLLSFGAVIGIAAVYPALKNAIFVKKGKQEQIGKQEQKGKQEQIGEQKQKGEQEQKGKRNSQKTNTRKKEYFELIRSITGNILVQTFLSSLSVQLMLLPILVWFFYEIPIYSLFINILIIPISSLLTILAFIAVLAGCIWIPAGAFMIGSVNYILEFYEAVCRIGVKLPGNSLLIGKPELLAVIIFYIILFFFVQCNRKKGRRNSLLLLLSIVILLVPFRAKNLEITFMDVGQGDGIFLKLPDGTNMFIDGGSSDVKNLGKYRLEPFLKYKGVKNIDYAVITHGDSDHYSGILEFLQADYKGDIRIRNLVLPNVSFTGDSYNSLIKAAKEKGVKVSALSKGDTMKNANVYLNCLWPDKELLQASGEASDTNSHSIVLSLHYLDFDLLLTGDLEGMGEKIVTEEIEEEKGRGGIIPLRYDILKVAHHGSKYSTSNEFLEATAPALAIISSGMDNSYGHPHKETLDRLTINKSAILQTKECGAVTVFTNGRQIKILEYNR